MRRYVLPALLFAYALASLVSFERANSAGLNPTLVDRGTGGQAGQYASMTLDGAGNPVISYQDSLHYKLNVVHCNDPNCSGGDEAYSFHGFTSALGAYTSLDLDGAGNPVVSYYDGHLKLLHCNDPNCAGDNESVTTADASTSDIGSHSSLELDGAGNPVISYRDEVNKWLKLVHCNDPNCAGLNESIVFVDSGGLGHNLGLYTSLQLDSTGNPMVSYYDGQNGRVKVAHCDDPNCLAGGNSISTPDPATSVGLYTSLALDTNGYPVVSYYGNATFDLSVLHCNDVDCAGGDESVTSPDTAGDVGKFTSIELNSAGNPLVSYYGTDLKILACDDPNCSGAGESIVTGDTTTSFGAGFYTSVSTDVSGNPVVAYYGGNADLKLLHCDDPACVSPGESIAIADTGDGNFSPHVSVVLDGAGYPVTSYAPASGASGLKVAHCNDPYCSGSDESISSPGSVEPSFTGASLKLDSSGNPVLSFFRSYPPSLVIVHCDDPDCAGSGDSLNTVDNPAYTGSNTALALDSLGNPVVSYFSFSGGLHILHCNDADCAGGDETKTTPDASAVSDPSLVLDGSGNPVVSYRTVSPDYDLTLLRCDDPDCSGTGESITKPDTTSVVDFGTSMALDASGNPIIAYHDYAGGSLKVMHCNDAACAGNNENLVTADTSGFVGWYPSLKLSSVGNPVITYAEPPGSARMLRCDDPGCTGGGESIISLGLRDALPTALALDSSDNPVLAYIHDDDLVVLHCDDPLCDYVPDNDGDGCPSLRETNGELNSQFSGGRRNPKNQNDYFNPTADGMNRVDDILMVVNQYFDDDNDANPGLPPYASGYNPDTDRTLTGPLSWQLGPPNGLQRVDDIVNEVNQYFHDCS